MIDDAIRQVEAGADLTMEQMAQAVGDIMHGRCSQQQIARLLSALHRKGESVAEVAGAASAMRACMTPIRTRHPWVLDTCGTGGDGSGTFNISTAAALVIAATGVPVAKHGNRGITSRSGSADVLAALGVNIQADLQCVERCLDELGICFCFAPLLHRAMRHVAEVRKQLPHPTIFNILGPLVNPAGACFQLLGVGRPELQPLMAEALALLGTRRSLVVRGADGLDEVTLTERTSVIETAAIDPRAEPGESDLGAGRGGCELADERKAYPSEQVCRAAGGMGDRQTDSSELPSQQAEQVCSSRFSLRSYSWTPEDFGLPRCRREELLVDGPEQSAQVIRSILDGQPGAPRNIVIANAAAGLLAVARYDRPLEAAQAAAQAIDSGAARRLLERLAALSRA
jgi:anthranilate phosphoribosyltransferase